MRAQRTQLIIILSSMLLAACAGQIPVHQPLSTAARSDLEATDVVLPIQQSEIYVFVPHSTAASTGLGGGLLGALIDTGIDSVRTSKAETAVTPLRNALVDYSFDNALQTELKASLAQVAWLHAGSSFTVVRDVSNDNLDKTLAASRASAILFVLADYRLSNDGDEMLVTLQAALIPNNDQLRALRAAKHDDKIPVALSNALYRNRFIFEAHVSTTGDRNHNIAEWSADNASAARAALTMAARKLAPLLIDDLQRAESDVGPPANAPYVAAGLSGEVTECGISPSEAQCGKTAMVLSQDRDGEAFRYKDGSIKYLKIGNF
ncbi:MAG TPA: hypothetical protein VMU22_01060 [Rhizomicrobium sp.]|nr:hypothetical protein [Rhizomicrobium sp.]